ncbi:MAG: histidine kinase [Lachnospiraceae bacterium]|nr:histidine kinase [Lachnospiraceae bacterium]
MKVSNFLQLKIYRKTFLIYLFIVTVFYGLIVYNCYSNALMAGQQAFTEQMNWAFTQVEDQLDDVTGSIDNFFTRLFGSPVQKEDFFNFFGATPSEYTEARLRNGIALYESYLKKCDNLVADCNHLIRYILYYSTENIMCMEYNQSGYSRCRMIEPWEGEALCGAGYVYARDIYLDSVYVGKVSFVIDVSAAVENAFCGDREKAVWLEIQGEGRLLGEDLDAGMDAQMIAEAERLRGRTLLPPGKAGKYFYAVNTSDHYSYMVVAAGRTGPYMLAQFRKLWVLLLGLLLAFVLITILYIRQFSADGRFLQDILRSMESARSGSFRRVAIGRHNDEYAAIARQLNGLYQYLETLIQQKYELTISQQRTQMQMLSSQLNPHFLYNTLERIRLRALRGQNVEIAEATANLGLLYRNIVKTEPVITLEKEIGITRQYLELMSFLYDDQFFYHCDVEEELMGVLTPKIWMQPIMENFFKHNFREDDRIKIIVLRGERWEEGIRLTFFDNMGYIREEQMELLNERFTPEEGRKGGEDVLGIGLQNVYYRLWLYYGDRVRMKIQNNDPTGVCIEVLLKQEGES